MIAVKHVSKRFGKVTALDDVSLDIGAGERVALIGTNGSGKTTLLRAVCGLLRVEGKVELDGHDVALQPEGALARLAYMPQVAPPLDAPVRELVRTVCSLRGREPAEVEAIAARLGLELKAVAGTRTRDLSGGMKQKLLAALALAAKTEVLVCDEPTANLDVSARDAFFSMVAERPPSSVLVVCSHRVEEVRRFVDRVIEMRDGRVERDVVVRAEPSLRSVR
jgi:ABC-2 type transport system ATP-binding protein